MISFYEFIKLQEEAAPVAGGGPSAPNSNKTNDFRYATRELGSEFDGLEPKDYLKEPITSFEPIDQAGEPKTSSPVFIDLEDSEDGNLSGKVMYSLQNRQKMRNPNGTQFKGDLTDKKLRLRGRGKNKNRTLDDILLKPFDQAGGAGGAPPMGGMGMGGM